MTDQQKLTLTPTPELSALVRHMLAHPEGLPWTLMGFGMLRCDIDGRDYRLHVWDRRFRTDGVASIHDHPWDLESLVLSGSITNTIYEDKGTFELKANPHFATHYRNVIEPGPDGGEVEPPELVRLAQQDRCVYGPGSGYRQTGAAIHDTEFVTGTVTLVRRMNRATQGRRGDRARIYWPKDDGPEWGEAIPVEATTERVRSVCEVALAMWGEVVPA